MSSSLESIRLDKGLIAHTAAAIYGGAAFNGLVESLIPGDPSLSMIPGLIALAMFAMLLAVGPRLPRRWLAPVGPIGVALIAYALSESPGAGDGAILYTWPVLWTAFFFGRWGAVAIMACIALAHGVTLLELPADSSFAGRWIDVFVSLSVVAAVVETLARRSDSLLARLAGEARTDTLTGLLNRRGFDERAAFELAHARRNSGSVAAVAFDIDRFKHINDEWGHEIGDHVLARVGGLLAAHSREIDVTARLGGDEFVVLLPGGARADAEAFTRRVRGALAADDASGFPTVRLSAGIAVELAPQGVETLLRSADVELYATKRSGRDVRSRTLFTLAKPASTEERQLR